MPKRLTLALLLLVHASAFSASPAESAAERARDLRERARTMRASADSNYAITEHDCYSRFLVNRCIDQAKLERLARIREARLMEIEANRLELAERQRVAAEQGLPVTTPPAAPTPEQPRN
ncbi:MAG: hypothetical protein HYS20_10190 [Rhodocyclales bacterium]|nr:hypothetical protein [Rhodocyclales bacterium]